MTENPQQPPTYIAASVQSSAVSPKALPTPLHQLSSHFQEIEEEPYTIRCICGFDEDDGNTIYCDRCDTWQHIECYYPDSKHEVTRDDFDHVCAICHPRSSLNRQRACELQRQRQMKPDAQENAETKPKRPPSKSHKKKAKPAELQLKGPNTYDSTKHIHETTTGHRKSKSVSKASQSTNSQPPKRSPSQWQKNPFAQGKPPSPVTTPSNVAVELGIHSYSREFMSLYDGEHDLRMVHTNSFVSLSASCVTMEWLRDPEKLKADSGREYDEVFQRVPADIASLRKNLAVDHKSIALPDRLLRCPYLKAPEDIGSNVPLVELNGQVGIQKDYCVDKANRWADLCSPLPLVFFHPLLPLYIDTRREGSIARYVRRSCKPNAILDTYLSEGSEYHFWLVSDRPILKGEQITIPWDFRVPKHDNACQLIGLDFAAQQPPYDPNEVYHYMTIASWLNRILSEYGGCACDLGPDCAFVRFHRTYISRAPPLPNTYKKRARKTKTSTTSPSCTGHAADSRAPSEGQVEDGADLDGSTSSRSKPASRDMTPARQGSFDMLGILTEPTDRDKRKVAMVEDSFRRMEEKQPTRKKKRASESSGNTGTAKSKVRASISQAPTLPSGNVERSHVDVATTRSTSETPSSAVSPKTAVPLQHSEHNDAAIPIPPRQASQCPRPEYCDKGVQTDNVEGEWFSPPRSSRPKRKVVTLTQRLMANRHRLRADKDCTTATVSPPSTLTGTIQKLEMDSPLQSAPASARVRDADTIHAPSASTPGLKIEVPPVPMFNATPISGPSTTTPLSKTVTSASSPFSTSSMPSPSPFVMPCVNGVAHASPVKKKLSLSDYTSRRMKKAANARSMAAVMKTPTTAGENKPPPGVTTEEPVVANARSMVAVLKTPTIAEENKPPPGVTTEEPVAIDSALDKSQS